MMHIGLATIVKTVLVLIAFYAAYLLREILLVLLASIVVASAAEPAALWFIRRRIPRTIAVLLVYAGAAGVFGGIFYLLFPPIVSDVRQFFASIPSYVELLDAWNPWRDVFTYQSIFGNIIPTGGAEAWKVFGDASGGIATGGNAIVRTVGGIFGGVFNFILVLVISFYLAVQERGIENFLKVIVPERHEKYVIDLWTRSQAKIGLWMQGQLLLGVLVGILVFLGLTILDVPHAFTFALLAAIFELIPVFGPILAAIPAVIIAFAQSAGLGLTTLGLYMIIQQFENHLIYPVVVRKVVGVPPILVIIALLVGAELAGFIGIILSVPLAAALMEFVSDIERKKAGTFAA